MNIKKDGLNIKRQKKGEGEEEEQQQNPAVTLGAVDRVIDLAYNPSRDKIREMTFIDRMQARLLPQLDIIDMMCGYVIEVAIYRKDKEVYLKAFKKKMPILPHLIDEFIYRTAQWQKSVQGMNLKSAVDLALAETEAKAGAEGELLSDFED